MNMKNASMNTLVRLALGLVLAIGALTPHKGEPTLQFRAEIGSFGRNLDRLRRFAS